MSSPESLIAPGLPLRPLGLLGRIVRPFLPRLRVGRLAVDLPGGRRLMLEGKAPGPEARAAILHWRVLPRLIFSGGLGFAAAYVEGEVDTPDLGALFNLVLANEQPGRRREGWLAGIVGRVTHRLNANSRRGSRRNIAAHYDLGNDFFLNWLDAGMQYSSADYRTGAETLEAAQLAKLDRVMAMLQPEGAAEVLEIGFGWGAVAERLLDTTDARLTGVTLSAEQLAFTRQRVAAAGTRTDLRYQDYRDIDGRYDRIVSIEMFEAVGERYWPVFFDRLSHLLAADGAAVLQVITISPRRFERYRRSPDFIQRYVFPGGMLPTVGHVEAEAARAGLAVVERDDFGPSYARTLADWRARFDAAWPQIARLGFDERFRRLWTYYLVYCEVGFASGTIDVSLFRLKHSADPGTVGLG